MHEHDTVSVQVAYARADVQRVIDVEVSHGSTLRAAIERSKIMEEFPEIDLAVNQVGVFAQRRGYDELVQAGDRIEIYRPLLLDVKKARRERAAAKD